MDATDQVPAVPAPRRAARQVLHSEARALTDMIDRLSTRFPLHSRATVAEIVSQAHQGYDQTALRDFIPLLVEREARRKLELAATQARADSGTVLRASTGRRRVTGSKDAGGVLRYDPTTR